SCCDRSGSFQPSRLNSTTYGGWHLLRRECALGAIDPGLSRGLVVVWVAPSQQHAAVAKPGLRHEMTRVVHLAGNDQEFPACRIENFHVPAPADNQKPPGGKLHRFLGQLEAAIVQRRRSSELPGMRIVDFSAVHGAMPV